MALVLTGGSVGQVAAVPFPGQNPRNNGFTVTESPISRYTVSLSNTPKDILRVDGLRNTQTLSLAPLHMRRSVQLKIDEFNFAWSEGVSKVITTACPLSEN